MRDPAWRVSGSRRLKHFKPSSEGRETSSGSIRWHNHPFLKNSIIKCMFIGSFFDFGQSNHAANISGVFG